MEKIKNICSKYVAFLRCIYLTHQNNHWICKGNNFFGNHLLFERIYKSAQDDADLAAEKIVGLIGGDCLNIADQNKLISEILEKYSSSDLAISLIIEKDFLEFSKKFYEEIKKSEYYTIGFDDMIMSIASNREGGVYLLQQSFEINNKKAKINARKELIRKMSKK